MPIKKEQEITVKLTFNPEKVKINDFLKECRELYYKSLPYMDTATFCSENANILRKARADARAKGLRQPTFTANTVTANAILAHTFRVKGMRSIPPVQREDALKAAYMLYNQPYVMLDRMERRVKEFLAEPIPDSVTPENLDPTFASKQEVKMVIETYILPYVPEDEQEKLCRLLATVCHLFVPSRTVKLEILKNPAPKTPGTSPYRYVNREYYSKDIVITFLKGILASIIEARKKYVVKD